MLRIDLVSEVEAISFMDLLDSAMDFDFTDSLVYSVCTDLLVVDSVACCIAVDISWVIEMGKSNDISIRLIACCVFGCCCWGNTNFCCSKVFGI
jgi:hypothetical protein